MNGLSVRPRLVFAAEGIISVCNARLDNTIINEAATGDGMVTYNAVVGRSVST